MMKGYFYMESAKKYLTVFRLLALTLAVLPLAACGNGEKEASDDGSKLKYVPELNEVEIEPLAYTVFKSQLVSNGKLSAVSRSSLSFGTAGKIKSVNYSNGEKVSKGDVIGELYSEEQRLAYESARIALRKAELDLYDVLAGQGYVAKDTLSVPEDVLAMAKMRSGYDAAVNALGKASHDLESTVLKAPFSGKVADLKLKKYDNTSSDPFCTVLDDSRMSVDFTVLESEYSFLEKGLAVSVIPYFDQSLRLQGKVTSINPTVDKNGQISVRADIVNDGSLVDGMNVKVIVEKDHSNQLVVPKNAVLIRDNEEVLFRYKGGKAAWTYVHTVMSNSESYSVIANSDRGAELSAGDTVIVSGNLNLADGSEVVLKK